MKFKIITFESLPSTSQYIKNNSQLPQGSVIHALEQTCGYGQKGRPWISPEGNIYASVLLPHYSLDKVLQLPFVVAVAVGKVVNYYVNKYECINNQRPNVSYKWPNDIIVNHKKMGGILVEPVHHGTIVGIGLNVNQAPHDKATSLKNFFSADFRINEILEQTFNFLGDTLRIWSKDGFSIIRAQWLEQAYKLKEYIKLSNGDEGFFETIENTGALKLRTSQGVKFYNSVEIL